MLTVERQNEILDILNEKKSVKVDYLASKLYVSGATIRRDLAEMEKMGLLKRSHGGATLYKSTSDESAFLLREQENTAEKRIMASLAKRFISNGNSLFMDSSSTTGMLIPYLKDFKSLTIITSGLRNAYTLSQTNFANVYIAGGHIQNHSNSTLGIETIEYISRLHADIAILSCTGIDANGNITDTSIEQAKVKQQMLKNSKTSILLCDSSKFGKTFMANDFSFNEIDYLITDKTPDAIYLDLLSSTKCQLVTPF